MRARLRQVSVCLLLSVASRISVAAEGLSKTPETRTQVLHVGRLIDVRTGTSVKGSTFLSAPIVLCPFRPRRRHRTEPWPSI